MNGLSIVARSLIFGLSILPLAAADDAQLLAEFQKTKADVSNVHVIAASPLVVATTGAKAWEKGELLGVFAPRGAQVVPISILPNEGDRALVFVNRETADSITLGLVDPDIREHFDNIKVFFDPKNYFPRRIVRFPPVRIQRITATAGVVTLFGSNEKEEFTAREHNGAWHITTARVTQPVSRPSFESAGQIEPMPVSTFGEFEQARPNRAKQLSQGGVIQETAGPYQKIGNKIWVGKAFTDSEDSAGVGDVGYYDEASQSWVFLHLPEMADWSASALMVETGAIWVGRARFGDGTAASGGLLRYDRANKQVTKIDLPDEIEKIIRVGSRLYCGTSDGFAIVDGDHVRRFEFSPQMDGTYAITPVT